MRLRHAGVHWVRLERAQERLLEPETVAKNSLLMGRRSRCRRTHPRAHQRASCRRFSRVGADEEALESSPTHSMNLSIETHLVRIDGPCAT